MPLSFILRVVTIMAFTVSTALADDRAAPFQHGQKTSARVYFDRISDKPPKRANIPAALSPAQGQLPRCEEPKLEVTAMPAGQSEIEIQSHCRRFEPVKMTYADVGFIRVLDEDGQLKFVLDCFAGDRIPVTIQFSDGTTITQPVRAQDLDIVTKIAVIWSAPVNLDLHAFEYSALPESPDHVWAGAPRTEAEARTLTYAPPSRGHGFLSMGSNGREPGAKAEVYTFFRNREQKRGVINMALDYESRARDQRIPDTCGSGLYSELEYEAILFDRNKAPERMFRKFLPLDCSIRLSGIDRLNHKTVPEIIIRQ